MSLNHDSPALAALSPAQYEQLRRFLPVDLGMALDNRGIATVHALHAIQAHLAGMLTVLSTMVPRWVLDSMDDPVQTRHIDTTLLLADITGFTPLTAQLMLFGRIGNEYITDAVNRIFQQLVSIVSAYGGDLLAFGGDAILVAFSDRHHPTTASIAAWEMQHALASLDLGLAPAVMPPRIGMKIGLASGPLVLASLGSATRRMVLPLGSVLDVADMIAGATTSGQIRLDRSTIAGVEPLVHLAIQPDGSAVLAGLADRPPLPATPGRIDFSAEPIGTLITRITTLAPYVPPSVLTVLAGSPRAIPGDGEQRYVVSLFSHLAGLHALADRAGPQHPQLAVAAAAFAINRSLEIIESHGGALARVDIYAGGHKLLALFGAPVAHEHDIERATRAALMLRDAQQHITASIAAYVRQAGSDAGWPLAPLRIRSGINAGPVMAGMVGSPLRCEYTVMGDSVNVAARLMGMASLDAGEVLIGPSIYNHIGKLLDAETRTLILKGKPDPYPAWSIRTLRVAASARPLDDTPLIGRAEELRTLQTLAGTLQRGRSALLFIQGEAGIGKTRLIRALPPLLGSHVTCIETGSPGLVPVSFGLFRALLIALSHQATNASQAQFATPVDAIIARWCPGHAAELRPALAFLLGLVDAGPIATDMDPEAQQRILAWAIRQLLVGVAAERPLAWLCEDLHEADDASLALLERLLRMDWDVPFLLCATLRPAVASMPAPIRQIVESARNAFTGSSTLLELTALPDHAASNLLDTRLPGLASETRAALYTHAGGNPLFVTVLAQIVQQQRLLRPGMQGLVLRDTLAVLGLPRTLDELTTAQMDRLPAEVRGLARAAAVLAMADRVFPLWLLEQIVDEPHAIAPRLHELEQAQVLERVAQEPAVCYTFRHALFQQAAYDRLLERERRELHRRVALALHERSAQGQAVQVEVLAHHSYEGQCWDLAARYTLGAGQRALRTYANRDAWRLLRRALGLARRLGWRAQEAEARERLGELYALFGRYAPARAQLERAVGQDAATAAESAHSEARARRHRLLALVAERTGVYDLAEAECRAGLRYTAGLEPTSLEFARLSVQLAEVLWRRGDFAGAEQVCREGLAAFRHEGATREQVALMQRLAFIDGQRGNYALAAGALKASLALARPLGDPWLIAQILNNLGMQYIWHGELSSALACLRESLAIKEQIGDTVGRVRTLENLGVAYLNCNDLDAALSHFLECQAISTRLNLPQSLANVTVNIGHLCFLQGRLDQAEAHLHQAQAIYESLDDPDGLADCLYRLGDLALAQRQPAAAYEYGQQALVHARHMRSDVYEACALRVIGEALLEQRRLAEAAAYLDHAGAVQARVDNQYDQVLLLKAQALLAQVEGRAADAGMLARTALELARAQKLPYLVAMIEAGCQSIGAW